MSVEANKASALAIVQDVAAFRLDRAAFTDDASWWMLGARELPIDAFIAMARNMYARLLAGPGQMTIHGITAEGDRVAIESEVALPLQDGNTYTNQYHFLVLFRDGKACQVKEYYDTALARATLTGLHAGDQ